MKLNPNEVELKGNWILIDSSIEADEVCKRIEKLTKEYLIQIGTDKTGWNKLFQDPSDDRYWELTYPSSESHGGGAPLLRYLSPKEAQQKYQL